MPVCFGGQKYVLNISCVCPFLLFFVSFFLSLLFPVPYLCRDDLKNNIFVVYAIIQNHKTCCGTCPLCPALLGIERRCACAGIRTDAARGVRQLLSLTEGRLQPSSFISGQAFGYSDVESTGMLEMIVVVFQPFAAKAFLHMPVSEFRGMNVNTEETDDPQLVDLGRRVADMPDQAACIRLIEKFLLSRLYAFSEYNLKRVSTALEAVTLHPYIRTAQLADVACLSNKQFGRVFAEYVGATPKEFLRIVRMQRALYTLQCQPGISFAQLAYECGFFDQSHMIKEFKLFSGYTPAEYLAVCAPYSDYFSVEE